MTDDTEFWMHEDANDPDEFGGTTPEDALRLWLLYGIGTDDFDCDNCAERCISDMVEAEHRIFRMRWHTVRDQEHLEELREDDDPSEDWTERLSIGDRFYCSSGSVLLRASLTITYEQVTKKSEGEKND